MTKTPDIITFGCRLNAYESEVMRRHATAAGADTDLVIVNTCAVTAEATRQARQAIRRARRQRPDARIVVTGCAAQIDPDGFAAMPEVDRVLGNQEKLEAESFADLAIAETEKVRVNDIFSVKETAGHLIDGLEGRARAFVQVQNGCDHRCTFCIIPYGRGNSRSVPMGVVVEQIRRLTAAGYNEVVLTGVDITSYGADLPGAPPLGALVRKILTLVPELPRLRLSSIDSIEVDRALLEAIVGEPRVMPHLHLSLQAGDNLVLKRMKRRHSREDAVAFCTAVRARRPEVVFGADLIAGFPTETQAMFDNTAALVADCDLTFLHVFPYSERDGTPAARMPQVDPAVRRDRAARLRALGQRQVEALHRSLAGRLAQVLVERIGRDGRALGHTEQFASVVLDGPHAPGPVVPVRLAPGEAGTLTGRPLAEAAE